MRAATSRLAFIDALKAIGSQLIVLHHLAFYGPMSDYVSEIAPALITWLSQEARIAVQVFLVIGGFLAAKGLAPLGKLSVGAPLATLRNRYRKLTTPYVAALLLAICCAALARQWMDHDSIPDAPQVRQFLIHTLLLQNLLDYDALSAGVWYVAIDFQLFGLLLCILWLARGLGARINGTRILSLCFIAGLGIASLFHFNRDADWDNWGVYFFGSYALGTLTYWASGREQKPVWLGLIAAVVIGALLIDFRSRIAVALAVALALGIARRTGALESWPNNRAIAYLGQISYSVFLLNFPVGLVVNALFARFAPEDPAIQAIGMLLAWIACIGAGALFYHCVERRARRWEEWTSAWTVAPFLRLFGWLALKIRLRP